jgi:hypothetical protein
VFVLVPVLVLVLVLVLVGGSVDRWIGGSD